jgi:uncharacterized membrane protein YjjP (DUF1212 family)
MNNLSQKARKCAIKFVEWGGLAGLVSYLLEGELLKAVLVSVIFGVVVVVVEYYFRRFP